MMRHLVHLAVAGALLTGLPAGAFADLSIGLDNQELTAAADAIVIGRATAVQPRWVDRTLVTAVAVQVNESIKGTLAGSVEVLLPGGVDATRSVPVAMTFAGAPTMRPGEEVFLFLDYSTDLGGYIVSGFAQGKFSIVTDAGGVRRVSRDLRGSQLIEGTGISRGTVTMAPLSTFRAEIVSYLGQ